MATRGFMANSGSSEARIAAMPVAGVPASSSRLASGS
jgi:hypothetical protein